MLGATLADAARRRAGCGRRSTGGHRAVKEAVLPFNRFPDADTVLGPEMRSTGEVMGIDRTFGLAFAKASWPPATGCRWAARCSSRWPTATRRSALRRRRIFVEHGFQLAATSRHRRPPRARRHARRDPGGQGGGGGRRRRRGAAARLGQGRPGGQHRPEAAAPGPTAPDIRRAASANEVPCLTTAAAESGHAPRASPTGPATTSRCAPARSSPRPPRTATPPLNTAPARRSGAVAVVARRHADPRRTRPVRGAPWWRSSLGWTSRRSVGAVVLPSPIVAASGTAGHGAELAAYGSLASLGAVTVKSLAARAVAGNPAPAGPPRRRGLGHAQQRRPAGPGRRRLAAGRPARHAGGRRSGASPRSGAGRSTTTPRPPRRWPAPTSSPSRSTCRAPHLDGGRHLFAQSCDRHHRGRGARRASTRWPPSRVGEAHRGHVVAGRDRRRRGRRRGVGGDPDQHAARDGARRRAAGLRPRGRAAAAAGCRGRPSTPWPCGPCTTSTPPCPTCRSSAPGACRPASTRSSCCSAGARPSASAPPPSPTPGPAGASATSWPPGAAPADVTAVADLIGAVHA